jgi:septum formation protein
MSFPDILLASNSPRRREVLSWMGGKFIAVPAAVDETPFPAEEPELYVLRLAEAKARAAHKNTAGALILAADTTVADGSAILGKPSGPEEALRMLRSLRGGSHRVYTALAVLQPGDGRLITDICMSRVSMRSYTDSEIESYIESGDPLDKAGAYAIQHRGFHPVIHFNDCFANVIGLPLCHLVRTIKKLGIEIQSDVPAVCRQYLNYSCKVYRKYTGNLE